MTFPTGGRRRANEGPAAFPYQAPIPDELTDSGVHRLMLGTRVRLHMMEGTVEVGLTTIKDVTTWQDLADRVTRCLPIEVMASRRRAFAGGVVLWAEVTSDPEEQPAA